MNRFTLIIPMLLSTVAFAEPVTGESTAPVSPASAESAAKPEAAASFSALDKDLNAKLSLDEVGNHEKLKAAFATVDTDKDGSLSRVEFDAWTKVSADKAASAPAEKAPATK